MLHIKETALKLEDSLQTVCSRKGVDQEIEKNMKNIKVSFDILVIFNHPKTNRYC